MSDLIGEVERLRLAADEVLIVRPKGVLTRHENDQLRAGCKKLAELLNVELDRVLILDRDVTMTVVKAEQVSLL